MPKTFTTEQFNETKTNIIEIMESCIVEKTNAPLTFATQNLAIHLTIATIRLSNKNYIPLSNSQIATYKKSNHYQLATCICKRVGEAYGIEFPDNEIAFVTMYISQGQILDNDLVPTLDLIDPELTILLEEAFVNINTKFQVEFSLHDTFFGSMSLHVQAALQRLHENQQVDNPLTDKIKERHPQEFAYANEINELVKRDSNLSLTDDEIAFIALHFVLAVLQKNKQ